MRNLKKLLAVIVSVCVLATFTLPAFAAEKTAAEICEDLGVLKGDSSEGVTDTYLAKGTTRMQAALLFLRLIGKEDEALAFEGTESFSDADETWAAAKPVLAYLKANPDLGWAGRTDGTFDPTAAISAQELYKVLLESLGYKQGTDFEWADVFTFAADNGFTLIADVTDLTNNDLAIALEEALNATLKDSETTLIEDLVAKGVVTEADAIAAGLIEAVPDELEVESVTSTNLIQAVVTFNQKVDKDTATDKDNYDFATADKITVNKVDLQDDGVSVVLTFATETTQQKTAKLTVSGVKTAAGATMTKSTTEVSFLDNTIPEIVSAEVAGISTIKVTFSEPMNPATVLNTSFKVNDGKYYVKNVRAQTNYTEFMVELYTSLKDGDLPFEVKVGPADYAGFTAMGLTTTLTVVEDKEAPVVVSYKDAKPNSVVLIWNEEIELVNSATSNYYHTNSNNQIAAPLTIAEISGKEMTLKFADAKKLPNGTAYAYVLKEAVKDLWNNKNAQQMTAIDVVVDKDPPVLQSIDFKAEDQIVLVFDEDVSNATAIKRVNYTILDKDGKEVKNIIKNATVDGKKVTVNFNKKLDGGDYTIVIEDIEDLAGNEISSTSMGFTVTDKTAPVASKFSAKVYTIVGAGVNDQILKVSFGEAMAIGGTYGIDDLAKYVFFDGRRAEKIDDVTLAVVDDGKAVEITIPAAKYTVPIAVGALTIARVADASDNYTVALTNVVDITASGNITIEKAELTGEKEVKVYFSDELAKLEAEEVDFIGDPAGTDISTVTTDLKDGKTVATYTLSNALPYDASGLFVSTVTPVLPATLNVTENKYGETLAIAIAPVAVTDKLAPAIAKVGDDDDVSVSAVRTGLGTSASAYVYTSTITLTFKEALNPAYLHYGSFEVSGFDVTGISLSGGNQVVITVVDDEIFVEENVAITLKSGIRDVVAGEAGNELTELDTSVMRSLDAAAVQAVADGVALTFAPSTAAAGTVALPTVAAGYTITVKSTSAPTIYDADGKIQLDGTSNVVYTVTHTASGRAADTGTVVVTVDVI